MVKVYENKVFWGYLDIVIFFVLIAMMIGGVWEEAMTGYFLETLLFVCFFVLLISPFLTRPFFIRNYKIEVDEEKKEIREIFFGRVIHRIDVSKIRRICDSGTTHSSLFAVFFTYIWDSRYRRCNNIEFLVGDEFERRTWYVNEDSFGSIVKDIEGMNKGIEWVNESFGRQTIHRSVSMKTFILTLILGVIILFLALVFSDFGLN